MTVIIGAGLAGLTTALRLSPTPCTLVTAGTLLTETAPREPASAWAQGGIAGAVDPQDHPALHAADTLAAGAGLCDEGAVASITAAAPAAIDWLVRQGVPFDRTPTGALALGLEGAHGRRRIVHAHGDSTGAEIMRTLAATVARTPSITVLEHARATRVVTGDDGAVTGVEFERAGRRTVLPTTHAVLATGGTGGLWSRTTNPLGSYGQGFVLAARAGARLRDLEMVQFHPTALDVGGLDPMPLVSEAVRGEGAILVTADGRPLLDNPLAARDIVARAVFAELQRGGRVYLDARAAIGAEFPHHFPTVTAKCRAAGIDPVTEPLPVSPAAHYHMGGVLTGAPGRTTVPGLWAVGEVASTGLHGANRLASNSLLEAVVMGTRAAEDIAGATGRRPIRAVAAAPASPLPDGDRPSPGLRHAMFDAVGVVRDGATLRPLVARLADEAVDRLRHAGTQPGSERPFDAVPTATLAALAIAWSALRREESRGAHARADFPAPAAPAHQTLTLDDLLLADVLA
jgi:L-aspartate oxidase